MAKAPCAAHPQAPAVARCFRCFAPVCRACRVRVLRRTFCPRGCSAIYLLQRAAAEDWRYFRRAAASTGAGSSRRRAAMARCNASDRRSSRVSGG